jgi:hypothetical protein
MLRKKLFSTKTLSNFGDLTVPLSILTKSSGKTAEFYFERIWREKNMPKLLILSKKWALVLSHNLYEKTKNSGIL